MIFNFRTMVFLLRTVYKKNWFQQNFFYFWCRDELSGAQNDETLGHKLSDAQNDETSGHAQNVEEIITYKSTVEYIE